MCVCLWSCPYLLQSVLDGLAQKNHVTELQRTPGAVVQAIVRQGDKLCAECDFRKGGYPAGYWTPFPLTICGPSETQLETRKINTHIQMQQTFQSSDQQGPQCSKLHKDSLYLLFYFIFYFLMGKCFIGIINSA